MEVDWLTCDWQLSLLLNILCQSEAMADGEQ